MKEIKVIVENYVIFSHNKNFDLKTIEEACKCSKLIKNNAILHIIVWKSP